MYRQQYPGQEYYSSSKRPMFMVPPNPQPYEQPYVYSQTNSYSQTSYNQSNLYLQQPEYPPRMHPETNNFYYQNQYQPPTYGPQQFYNQAPNSSMNYYDNYYPPPSHQNNYCQQRYMGQQHHRYSSHYPAQQYSSNNTYGPTEPQYSNKVEYYDNQAQFQPPQYLPQQTFEEDQFSKPIKRQQEIPFPERDERNLQSPYFQENIQNIRESEQRLPGQIEKPVQNQHYYNIKSENLEQIAQEKNQAEVSKIQQSEECKQSTLGTNIKLNFDEKNHIEENKCKKIQENEKQIILEKIELSSESIQSDLNQSSKDFSKKTTVCVTSQRACEQKQALQEITSYLEEQRKFLQITYDETGQHLLDKFGKVIIYDPEEDNNHQQFITKTYDGLKYNMKAQIQFLEGASIDDHTKKKLQENKMQLFQGKKRKLNGAKSTTAESLSKIACDQQQEKLVAKINQEEIQDPEKQSQTIITDKNGSYTQFNDSKPTAPGTQTSIEFNSYKVELEAKRDELAEESEKKEQEVPHFQTKSISGSNKRSKFHNLTKLFFNSLLVIFSRENLDKINIPNILKMEIMKIIHIIKNSGKKLNNNVHKTDLFNHSHYNALFLKITPQNLKRVGKNEKDVMIHQKCYNFDLKEKSINFKKLEFMNLLKQVNYEIVKLFFTRIETETNGELGQKNLTVKNQYMDRVMASLSKMIEGEYVMRF